MPAIMAGSRSDASRRELASGRSSCRSSCHPERGRKPWALASGRRSCRARSLHPGKVIVADNGSSDGSREIADRSCAGRGCPSGDTAPRSSKSAARGKFGSWATPTPTYNSKRSGRSWRNCVGATTWSWGNRFAGGIARGCHALLSRCLALLFLTAPPPLLLSQPRRRFHCGLRGFRGSPSCTRSPDRRDGVRERDGRDGDRSEIFGSPRCRLTSPA